MQESNFELPWTKTKKIYIYIFLNEAAICIDYCSRLLIYTHFLYEYIAFLRQVQLFKNYSMISFQNNELPLGLRSNSSHSNIKQALLSHPFITKSLRNMNFLFWTFWGHIYTNDFAFSHIFLLQISQFIICWTILVTSEAQDIGT